LEEALKRHEAMKDTIKDALILAQQSAKDKEDDAKRRADVILSKAEAKIAEFEAQGRRRVEEAEASADDIIAAARTSAAQVSKNAENMRDEAQRRLDNMETEISRRMAEANEKAADITAAARLEARRVVGKAKHEIEEGKKELSDLQLQRRRFLRETHELAASFSHLIDESIRRLDKGNSSWDDAPGSKIEEGASSHFSSIADDADETDIS
jgi:cell division septum initiation protein DivIVA